MVKEHKVGKKANRRKGQTPWQSHKTGSILSVGIQVKSRSSTVVDHKIKMGTVSLTSELLQWI